jgi:hypothetical protein
MFSSFFCFFFFFFFFLFFNLPTAMMIWVHAAFSCFALAQWSTTTGMVTSRDRFPLTSLNGFLLAAGGRDGNSLNAAEMFDPSAKTWTSVGSLKNPRHFHTAIAA